MELRPIGEQDLQSAFHEVIDPFGVPFRRISAPPHDPWRLNRSASYIRVLSHSAKPLPRFGVPRSLLPTSSTSAGPSELANPTLAFFPRFPPTLTFWVAYERFDQKLGLGRACRRRTVSCGDGMQAFNLSAGTSPRPIPLLLQVGSSTTPSRTTIETLAFELKVERIGPKRSTLHAATEPSFLTALPSAVTEFRRKAALGTTSDRV